MDDLIQALHDTVAKLLEQAQELDTTLDDQDQDSSPGAETLRKIRDLLHDICDALTRTTALLRDPKSPLHELVKRLDGVPMVGPASFLKRFLDEHEKFLIDTVRVPPKMV